MDTLARPLKASPELFAYALDPIADAVGFVRLDRQALRAASFLDERILGQGVQQQWRRWPEVEAVLAEAALPERCDFIFHIGHVGSTLLSRLLEAAGGILSLREPAALRVLARAQSELGSPESLWSEDGYERRLGGLLQLWSRPFAPGETTLIKATSFCCGMAEALLGRPSRPRALLVYTSPETYLATLFGGASNLLDIRNMAQGRLRRLHARLGAEPWRLHALGDAEISAMSWACEMSAMCAASAVAGGRAQWLDFERFLLRPQSQLAAAFACFGLDPGPEVLAQIVSGPLMTRYSKAPEHAYDAALRRSVLQQARDLHGAEIARGLRWLERAAAEWPQIAQALAVPGMS